MTIGTGIFLAALVLSLTYLFVATKDRWRWKRLIVGSIGALAAVVALAGGGLWGYNAWQDRVRPIDEINEIRLGMSKEDLVFFKGRPSKEVDGDWIYQDQSERVAYTVSFKEGGVESIMAIGDRHYLPTFFGISSFSSTRDLERRLGPPDYVSASTDGTSRMLHYKALNLTFGYGRDQLEAVGVRVGGRTWTFTTSGDK